MYKYISQVDELINEVIEYRNFREISHDFYRSKIKKFFYDYMDLIENRDKPLNAITYYDINTYLGSIKTDKTNIHSALNCFFQYTYSKGITGEIMSQVEKPERKERQKVTLSEENYIKVTEYIFNRNNNLKDRLALGLFLFTGLSRQYIASLRNSQFVLENGSYVLSVWKDDEEYRLPLKAELQLLINEYCLCLVQDELMNKVIDMDENNISTYISNLMKKIIGKKCTPTILANTFIKKALTSGNYILEISKLTLESVTTISAHVQETDDIMYKQTSILNSF